MGNLLQKVKYHCIYPSSHLRRKRQAWGVLNLLPLLEVGTRVINVISNMKHED